MLKFIFIIRAILFMPFVIILTALVVAGIVVTMPLAELTFNKDKVFKLGTIWMKLFSKPIVGFLNLNIKVQGLENIPSGQKGSLILFKHTSHLDIPILVSSLPMDFRFGAKIELFKVPIFGTGMKLVKTLPIDRGDRDKVLALYKKSVPNVEQGLSYALAPEGTRKSMDELGGFVTGPFLFALQAQADILPVFISGAYDAYPSKSVLPCTKRWSHSITVQILKPLSTQGYSLEDVKQLKDKTREEMEKAKP